MIYLPSKKPTFLPIYLCIGPTFLPNGVYWGENPILTQLIDGHSGGPLPEEVKQWPYIKLWFSLLRFILLECVNGATGGRGKKAKWIVTFGSFCRLTRVLDSCVSIGSFGTNKIQHDPTLLRKKLLNLVVQGGLVKHGESPREVWAFVVNQKGQNLHHDQASFSSFFPIFIIIIIIIIFYFYWGLEIFINFFPPKNYF